MPKLVENTPEAGSLVGSMRSMGYTFESAVADIVDNSVTAGSSDIHVYFPTESSKCFVAILDNGCGMTREELYVAMRYGSRASEEERSDSDLGRFGLGMKAASLSQCRVMTVISKRDGKTSAFQWDYNKIKGQSKWLMLEFSPEEIKAAPHFEDLEILDHGTLVIWQDFDIIKKSSNGQVFLTLTEYKAKIIDYIGLIFHRFISAKKPAKIDFYVNKHKIEALDPFLESHPKTMARKEIDLAVNDKDGIERHIKAQPFILPFIKDLSEKDTKKLGGVENMRTRQGYYIYRNNRLIIWGKWFGQPRGELTKNARIRVDIPNTLDDIWGIDVKKQNATIPAVIRNQLRRAVEETMSIAIRQQTHRGRKENVDENISYVWNRIEARENHYYYEINRDSEIFKFVRSKIDDQAYSYIELLLDELEHNLPLHQMYLDKANNVVDEKEDDDRNGELLQKAIMIVDSMCLLNGKSPKDTIEILLNSEEAFMSNDALKQSLYTHYGI